MFSPLVPKPYSLFVARRTYSSFSWSNILFGWDQSAELQAVMGIVAQEVNRHVGKRQVHCVGNISRQVMGWQRGANFAAGLVTWVE